MELMAAETLSCPYCNSSVTLSRPAGAGQRLRCPRCHEVFPYHGGERTTPAQEDVYSSDPGSEGNGFGEGESQPFRHRPNRSVALIILTVMGAMAVIGFAFAWFTTDSRRQRDRLGDTSAEISSQSISVAPAKLAALGYLPEGTNAIAALHFAELMAQPETRAILQQMRADRANFGIFRLEQATGLPLEDIDHVVLGLRMQAADLPHIFLIVQTRLPYDEQAVRATLNAKRAIQFPDKTVYRIASEQIQPGGVLWCAGPRTLVFGLQPKDLAGLPKNPITGIERFPAQLQKCLVDRQMAEGTQAWVAGTAPDWDELLGFLQLFGLAEADRVTLNQVRMFCGRIHCGAMITGQLRTECGDEHGAEAVDEYLTAKGLSTRHVQTMAAKSLQAGALLQELAQSLRRERNGAEVRVQLEASTSSIRQALQAGTAREQEP
jgi:hypothetical protein